MKNNILKKKTVSLAMAAATLIGMAKAQSADTERLAPESKKIESVVKTNNSDKNVKDFYVDSKGDTIHYNYVKRVPYIFVEYLVDQKTDDLFYGMMLFPDLAEDVKLSEVQKYNFEEYKKIYEKWERMRQQYKGLFDQVEREAEQLLYLQKFEKETGRTPYGLDELRAKYKNLGRD